MEWYTAFAIISGSLIFIATIILSYKIIISGINTAKKNEAKESLMRLAFGGVAISFAPLFIRLLLYLNNSFIYLLVTIASTGSLDANLGESMLTSISTGNAITTAIVIAMFIYLFVKLNIKFIIREFTIIIFTIFTPIVAGLWIINKNVTAASIWAGQIIMNIFMQFIYCFLFLIYLAFLPSGGGWAVSLIWAMMILPLADVLQNCLQNLTSRIAGVDNEQMTGRVMGMGAMMGFGISAIKEQFKVPTANSSNTSNSNNSDSNSNGLKGFVNRAKSVISPKTNLSDETDYNGNVIPIRNVVKENNNKKDNTQIPKSTTENKENISNRKNSTIKNVARTGANATKAYLGLGAKMAEGDFSAYNYTKKTSQNNKKTNMQNTEYLNNRSNLQKGQSDEQK